MVTYCWQVPMSIGDPIMATWMGVTQLGRSPGLVVMGKDSLSEDCWFESQHRILDRHFFTLICCKNLLCLLKKTENTQKEDRDGPWTKIHTFAPFSSLSFSQRNLFCSRIQPSHTLMCFYLPLQYTHQPTTSLYFMPTLSLSISLANYQTPRRCHNTHREATITYTTSIYFLFSFFISFARHRFPLSLSILLSVIPFPLYSLLLTIQIHLFIFEYFKFQKMYTNML